MLAMDNQNRQNSDNRFRILADAAFEGIAFTRKGVLVDLNDQLARMLGYRREELIGKPVLDCVAIEDRERVAAFMAAGRVEPYEHLALRKDGTTIPVEIQVRHSVIDGLETRIAAIRDITERERAAGKLRASEKKLRQMLDHAGAILWTVDTDLRFTSTQGRDLARLNLTRNQVVGSTLFEFFGTDDPEFIAISAHRQALHGNSVTYEQVWSGVIFHTRLEPLYDARKTIVGVSGVAIDITERKRAEEALQLTQFTVDRTALGCSWIKRDGRFFYVNDHLCRSLGYTRQELLQMSVLEIDPGFDPSIWSDYWTTLLQARVRRFETVYRRKDGTTFPVEITANFVEFGGREYSCAFSADISDRKRAEEKLRGFQFSIDRAWEAIFWMGQDGSFLYVNDQACQRLGYSREELMALRLWDIDPEFPKERWQVQWRDMREVGHRIFETTHQHKDGSRFPVEVSANHMQYGDMEHHVAFVRDISYRKRAEAEQFKLESQLYQAQKMESIGRLAGGVAHDFNNMLGVILGYAELMKVDLAEADPLRQQVMEIEKAANHSKGITSQLLAFSRKQVVSPKNLDLNTRVREVQMTLARLIGEDIELRFIAGDDLWTIKFDPTQIEQILINLAINSRDAMPDGGKLSIETANRQLDEAYCLEHMGFVPGEYVQLSISDNGTGMAPETLAHIFEPFFTTKEVGKGTGLGLATVYGIVKQGGGFINAYSEPGHGTNFTIYLPRAEADIDVSGIAEAEPVATGTETILLVEDDEMVRMMTRMMLERIGYSVNVVATPEDALALVRNEGQAVDLLITDVVMPRMNGKQLHDRITAVRPGIKTLFMSGYTANVIVHHGVLDEGVHFIQKPFGLNRLAQKVREALN
jgi:PAS domain S-box-containing protein